MTSHPNRKRAPADPARNPTAAEVLALRESLGLSRAELVARLPHGITLTQLRDWEQGLRRCPPYAWAYIRAQLGLLRLPALRIETTYGVAPATVDNTPLPSTTVPAQYGLVVKRRPR